MVDLRPRFTDAVSPAGWGAQVDYDAVTWTPWVPDKWVLHWGGTPVTGSAAAGDVAAERAQLRIWENHHKNILGWLGIAYNWAVGNSGTLYRLRGDNRSGATAGDAEPDGIPENHEAVAVVFIVGSGQTVTAAALDTFRGMFVAVPELSTVTGHKFVALGPGYGTSTTCPGPQLSAFITNEDYRTPGGPAMPVGYPIDENDDPASIRFMQNVLNSAFGAGLTVDGVWGPLTTAAIEEHLELSGVPPFAASGVHRLHRWSIREYVTQDAAAGGWQEARVAGLEADVASLETHTHDEGETGPPV